jgi:hypothetical protein
MNRHRSFHIMARLLGTACVGAWLLTTAGCSSKLGTQSGSSASTGPQVVATPIGHKAIAGGTATSATIMVRSGADVLLSGKDSQPGSAPIKTFAWTQSTSDTAQADLIYVTSNTVDFTAPTVAAETSLNFKLTVTDSNGNSATAQVVVKVEPASDPDQFLTAPATDPLPRSFQVAVAPVTAIPAGADMPVCISLDRTVSYYERGPAGSTPRSVRNSVALPAVNVDATWLKASGGVGAATGPADTTYSNLQAAVTSYTNPRTTFTVPAFNDQDLFRLFNQPQGSNRPPAVEPAATAATRIAQQLVPADVDSATLSVTISATNGTCASLPAQKGSSGLIVAILGPSQTPVTTSSETASAGATLTFTADELLTTLAPSSPTGKAFSATAADTATYYANIDPIGSASHANQTLNAWLDANCFDHTKSNYGADSHAVYTNNFDLGFGRDMYFVTCAASNLSAGRQIGDSASVVINYASLEATTLKQNPIIAVAMSHNAWLMGGPAASRITKFFAFAPDDRDGNFYLVPNANFDHRGQKYLPGSCTVCHGGTVDKTTIAAGDLNSAFMPWDESSLLFADTDPSFTGVNVPKTGYNEADQTAAIYALNQHAYATFLNSDPANAARFAAPEALIQKWYGGLAKSPTPTNGSAYTYTDITFTNQKFDDSGFPGTGTNPTLDPAGTWAAENAANKDDLYHTVFAHECRACHTQLDPAQLGDTTPAADGSLTEGFRFSTYTDFKNAMVGANGAPGLIETYVFQQNVMPLARLTADRFWVNYGGGTSAATTLATHATNAVGVTGLLSSAGTAIPPGTAEPQTTYAQLPGSTATPLLNATPISPVARFDQTTLLPDQIRVDGSSSFFVSTYNWSLCLVPAIATGTPDASGTCNPVTDLQSPSGAVPAFSTEQAGIYRLSLTGTDSTGTAFGSQPPYQYTFIVPRLDPVAPSCALNVQIGSAVTEGLLTGCAGGNTNLFSLGDGTNTSLSIVASMPAFAYQAAPVLPLCPTTTPNSCAIQIAVPNSAAPGSSALTYQLCDNADSDANSCKQGVITVTATAVPVAPQTSSAVYYALPAVGAMQVFNSVPALQPATTASPLLPLTGAAVSIPVDRWNCTGSNAANVAGGSLAQFFTLTPCTDPFDLAFSASVTGTPANNVGPLTLTATGTTSQPLTLGSLLSVCDFNGQNCTGSSGTLYYNVTDATSGLTNPPAATQPINVRVIATQSFGNGAIANGTILSYLDTGWSCTSCHTGTGGATTAPGAWSITAAGGVYGSLSTYATGYSTAPTTAPLFKNACGTPVTFSPVHQTNDVSSTTSKQMCANLQQWIAEGAPNN